MSKIILKIALLYMFFSASIFSTPLLEDMKGLDVTNQGYGDLNPLHGYVWNQGILENHGEMLPQDCTLRTLIQLLFHRTGTFDPSSQPSTNSVVPHLTPKVIGAVLSALKSGKELSPTFIAIPEKPEYKKARNYRNKLLKYLQELKSDSRAYKVMLALLWHKANNKEDFRIYYEGVRSQNYKAIKAIPANWSKQKFTRVDATSARVPDFRRNYDAYLYWVGKHHADVPPLEHQGYSYIPEGFSDCGETSLKNFIKLMIDQNGTYSIAVLKSLKARAEVIKFFQDFPSRHEQTTQKARDAWAKVTTGLPGVNYKFTAYEICPRPDAAANMLAVLRALFTGLMDAKAWDEVDEKVQTARKQAGLGNFTIDEINLTSGFGTITFSVESFGKFGWYFQPEHFYIDPLPAQGLKPYPLNEINDIAVFYPPNSLPKKNSLWYLYAQLRQNEVIESALSVLQQNHQLTTPLILVLLNRLSTDDARKRVFHDVVSAEQVIDELVADKAFKPSVAYVDGLLHRNRFSDARALLKHSFFCQQVKTYFIGHKELVNSAMFSPDGQRVLTVSLDKTARLWDVKTGQRIQKFKGHTNDVISAVFSPDGQSALTASSDKTARLWDVQTGQEMQEFAGHTKDVNSAVFSPDGQRVLTASSDKTARLWDVQTGQEMQEFAGHTGDVNSAVFSPDGQRVLTASSDNTARLWDVQTGQEMEQLAGHTNRVASAVFSPDGQRVLTASFDKTARLWDVQTGQEMQKFAGHTNSVNSAVFSPDGQMVLTASSDKTARLWDVQTGQEMQEFAGHTGKVISAVFSPDGQRVLTASSDKTARLWDVQTGQEMEQLAGHTNRVASAVFSPDGQKVLTASFDKTVRIWD